MKLAHAMAALSFPAGIRPYRAGDTGYAQYMTAFNRNFGGSSGGGGGNHDNGGGGGDGSGSGCGCGCLIAIAVVVVLMLIAMGS